jgi:hypothetical protein
VAVTLVSTDRFRPGFLSVSESKIKHMFDLVSPVDSAPDPACTALLVASHPAASADAADAVDAVGPADPADPVDPADAADPACPDRLDPVGLDVQAVCAAVVAVQDRLRADEWAEIALAAQWAVLHDPDTVPPGSSGRPGRRRPGGERVKRVGGHGTPGVAEFACAELGMLMGIGDLTANVLLRDAVDLQHRHPVLWAGLPQGRGRVWKARKVARMVHAAGLTRDQARWVDAQTTPYVDTLPWGRFVDLVEAKVIEADPGAADARRLAAEMARFVSTGQSNELGLKTLIARASAGEVIVFVAMCDRIAQILLLQGDTSPVDVRRSKALGVLANPARALVLLEQYAALQATHQAAIEAARQPSHPAAGAEGTVDGEPVDPLEPLDPPEPPDPADLADPGEALVPCPACGAIGEPRPFRVDPDKLRPRAVLYVRISEATLRSGTGVAACANAGVDPLTVTQTRRMLAECTVTVQPVLDRPGQVPVEAYEVPAADPPPPITAFPTVAQYKAELKAAELNAKPEINAAQDGMASSAGRAAQDTTEPRAGTGDNADPADGVDSADSADSAGAAAGAAVQPPVGVITVAQVAAFVGHRRVRVRPLLDPSAQAPVDGYQVPAAMAAALKLTRPSSIYPWSSTRTMSADTDHTEPFVPIEDGGPPGQTRIENLGPITRFGHRVKTHGRGYRLRQPRPGVYLWRTPHGYRFRTDLHGTRALGRDPTPPAKRPAPEIVLIA